MGSFLVKNTFRVLFKSFDMAVNVNLKKPLYSTIRMWILFSKDFSYSTVF